ncbi:hypothetical protein EYR36_008209 [Pleurotus pulmonarius]|nr:hypothetical protein EYR36_008209 [Pleurotus pulmonarius]KAF4605962.1 hypothetical protein EYR38_000007 [Pleurotus pulmonarius]
MENHHSDTCSPDMSTIALPFILLVIGVATVTSVRKLFSALAKYTAQIRASFSDIWSQNNKTSFNDVGGPLSRHDVVAHYKEGTWQRQAFDRYTSVLLNEDLVFPCIYATKGFNGNEQRFVFIDSDDLSDQRNIKTLARALTAYLPQARSLGPNTSLVLLARENDNPRTIEEYNVGFWQLLDGLARLDRKAWPSDIPQEINTDRWCFCFGGEPFFTVVQTPAHQVRQSRYAKGLSIVFQPKWIFDILFSTDAKRAGALSKVRSLLAKYDTIPVSPELKNYGEEGSRESRQYFLLDENAPADCPLEVLGSKAI